MCCQEDQQIIFWIVGTRSDTVLVNVPSLLRLFVLEQVC